jgi:hypothetical protein
MTQLRNSEYIGQERTKWKVCGVLGVWGCGVCGGVRELCRYGVCDVCEGTVQVWDMEEDIIGYRLTTCHLESTLFFSNRNDDDKLKKI